MDMIASEQTHGETGRADFASGPALEAQQSQLQPRPLSILALGPPIQNVVASRSTDSPSVPTAPDQWTGVRRARSEPTSRRDRRQDIDMPHIVAVHTYSSPPTTAPSISRDGPVPQSNSQEGEQQEQQQHHSHHKHEHHGDSAPASRTTAVVVLLVSTALVSLCAEFMVSSIDRLVATDPGLSEAFIGLILLPVVGNAAEHVTAVRVALKNKMDLAIGVAVGSSIQIALFVTPLVVMLGWGLGKDMGLFFTLFETVCVFVSAFIVNFLVLDGRSNYLEGALLCAGYVIIAVAAFFYPDVMAANSLGGGS